MNEVPRVTPEESIPTAVRRSRFWSVLTMMRPNFSGFG